METTEDQPVADVDIPALDNTNFAPSWPSLGVLQRRVLLAGLLEVPAHVLSSSLREQTAHRIGQARRKRAALYRPALRASATAALTAPRDTTNGWVPAISGQKQCASVESMTGSSTRGSSSDGEGVGQDYDAVTSPRRAPPCTKSALTAPQHQIEEPLERPEQRTASTSTADATRTTGPATAPALLPAVPASTPFPSSPPRTRLTTSSHSEEELAPGDIHSQQTGSDATPAAISGFPAATSALAGPPASSLRRAAAEAEPPWRPGLPPIWVGPDHTLRCKAWDLLTDALDAAISACSDAGEAAGGERGAQGPPGRGGGGGGFSAKLRQSTALELHIKAGKALEELREAAARLPAHRVAWQLGKAKALVEAKALVDELAGQRARGGKSEAQQALVHGKGGGVRQGAGGKAAQAEQRSKSGSSGEEPPLNGPQLELCTLVLMRANVLLARPHPLARGGAAITAASRQRRNHNGGGDDGDDDDDSAAAAVVAGHDRHREHHRFCAVLLTDMLLRVRGRPLLPYPGLAALAQAQSELCPLLSLDDPPPPGSGADWPDRHRLTLPRCVTDPDLPMRLTRWCFATVAARSLAGARRPETPGARQIPSEAGPAAAASQENDGRPSCLNGVEPPLCHEQQRAAGRWCYGGLAPYGSWLDDAVRRLEELASGAMRAHVAAASVALERCRAWAEAGNFRHGAFREEYEEALRRSGSSLPGSEAAAAAVVVGGRNRGDGKKPATSAAEPATAAEPQAEAGGELLRFAFSELPRLVHWDLGSGDGRRGGRGEAEGAKGLDGPGGVAVGLEHGRALGLWQVGGGGSAAGAGGAGDAGASAAGEAALRRMALAQLVLQAALLWRPRRLAVAGGAALRSVLAAVSAVSLIRQASLPHPDAVRPSLDDVDGPVLMRFELAPAGPCNNTGSADSGGGAAAGAPAPASASKSAAAAPAGATRARAVASALRVAAGVEDKGASGGKDGVAAEKKKEAVWLAEEGLGKLTVTVVPRGDSAGQEVRRLCAFAREARRRLQSRDFTIEVPSAGFNINARRGQGGGKGGGSGGKPGERCNDGGAAAAGSLEDAKQRLQRVLGDFGCAWLRCPDREALHAAAMLVAEVHHDLQQEQQQGGSATSASARSSSAAAFSNRPSSSTSSAAAAVPPNRPRPGLEVLPCMGDTWAELLAREARGRVMQELQVALRPLPLTATQQPPAHQAQASQPPQAARAAKDGTKPASGSGSGTSTAQPRSRAQTTAATAACTGRIGGDGDGGGLLEDGWRIVRGLALNREAYGLMGLLLDGSCKAGPAARRDSSTSPAAVAAAAAAAARTSAAAATDPEGPAVLEAVSLLVLRQRDLDRVDGARDDADW